MALKDITGNLRTVRELDPSTVQHAHEIQAARLTDDSLCDTPYHTANACLYHVLDGKVQLGITRHAFFNPIISHLDAAIIALTTSGMYRPLHEEVECAFAAESTCIIDHGQLQLQENNLESKYLRIPTKDYNSLHEEERRLAECVHGVGDAFTEIMDMLAKKKIQETKIYILDRDFVINNAKEAALVYASWLSSIKGNFNFNACARNVNFYAHLRGEPLHRTKK